MAEASYIAVDWGTSSFRLWLVADDDTVLAESRGAEGMLVAARTGFEAVLAKHLAAVHAPPSLPVIICGMAGARGGWVEAGYIDTPASLSSIASAARPVGGQARDIRILPGLARRDPVHPDVMRGEETQLLGAAGSFRAREAMVCLPGTHSKWVSVDAGTVTGFSTYMTGELFDVITHHTILKQATEGGAILKADNPVFAAAVRTMAAQPGNLTRLLFGARSGQILHGLSPADATAHISGALIGAEIAGAMADVAAGTTIVLVATGRLQALYEAGFAALDLKSTTLDADSAVLKGLATAAHALWRRQP